MTKKYISLEHHIRNIVEGKPENNIDVDSIVESVMEELQDEIEELFNLSEELINEQAAPAIDFSSPAPANTNSRPRPNLKVIQGGATDAARDAARTAAQRAAGAGAEAATSAARTAARTGLRGAIGRAIATAGARHVAAGATGVGLHPAVQGALVAVDAALIGKSIYDYYTKKPEEAPTEEPAVEPQAEPVEVPQATPEAVPQIAPQAVPVVVPTPQTNTQTQTDKKSEEKKENQKKRILPPGLGAGTPAPATDSVAASPSDLSKYMHMAKPYVSRQQVKEDATEERSKIENVARPNSRRDKAVKQQEIQKKIIEEKKSLAQVVKKNLEDTRKEKKNSTVIINPTLNKPETGGY